MLQRIIAGGVGMARTLDGLKPGERGTVTRLLLAQERASGLARLGLGPGTEILCLRRTPLGEPTVYRFRGTDVALRRREAAGVQVRVEN